MTKTRRVLITIGLFLYTVVGLSTAAWFSYNPPPIWGAGEPIADISQPWLKEVMAVFCTLTSAISGIATPIWIGHSITLERAEAKARREARKHRKAPAPRRPSTP